MQTHNGLKITRIGLCLVHDPAHPELKAYAAVVFNGCLRVANVRVVKSGDKLVVAMPQRKTLDGVHVDQAHPTDNATRMWIERSVLEAYCREVDYAREWEEATRPVPSSCGHPTEEAFFERYDYQAAS